jgi:hypothetical protein
MDQSELSRIERSAVLGVSMTRQAAIARAVLELDSGAIQRDLARRVSLPTVSQAPEARSALVDYLEAEVVPALGALGFTTHLELHDEPRCPRCSAIRMAMWSPAWIPDGRKGFRHG